MVWRATAFDNKVTDVVMQSFELQFYYFNIVYFQPGVCILMTIISDVQLYLNLLIPILWDTLFTTFTSDVKIEVPRGQRPPFDLR